MVSVTTTESALREALTLAQSTFNSAHDAYQAACEHRARIIRLARERGLTYQEIADTCGVTNSAVRATLRRAGGAQ